MNASDLVAKAAAEIRAHMANGDRNAAKEVIKDLANKVPFPRVDEVLAEYDDPSYKKTLWGMWGPGEDLVMSGTASVEESFCDNAGMLMSSKGMAEGRTLGAIEIGVQGAMRSEDTSSDCPLCPQLDGMTVPYPSEEFDALDAPAHCNCLVDGKTKVMTSKGLVAIARVKVGDLVLTHKGRYRRVLKTFRQRKYRGDIYRIQLNGNRNRGITTTPEHPFLVMADKGEQWREMKDLKPGDLVSYLGNMEPCPICGADVPHDRKFCSRKCLGIDITDKYWKGEDSDKHKDYAKKIFAKARAKINALPAEQRDAHYQKLTHNAHEKTREMVRAGTHPLQKIENRKKAHVICSTNARTKGTFIERKMQWLLEEKGIQHERSYPIPQPNTNGNKFWWVDFALPDHKIAIECDGEHWHSGEEKIAKDTARQKAIESMGWTMLRFSGEQIRHRLNECSDEIDRVLANHEGKYRFVYVPIKSIEKISGYWKAVTRFNLEVEEDNSFVAGPGFVVHNCEYLWIYVDAEESNFHPDTTMSDIEDLKPLIDKHGKDLPIYANSKDKLDSEAEVSAGSLQQIWDDFASDFEDEGDITE